MATKKKKSYAIQMMNTKKTRMWDGDLRTRRNEAHGHQQTVSTKLSLGMYLFQSLEDYRCIFDFYMEALMALGGWVSALLRHINAD